MTPRSLALVGRPAPVSREGLAWRVKRLADRLANPREATLGLLLLLPAALLLALTVGYPIARLLWSSVHDLRLGDGGSAAFVGLRNFTELAGDPDFRAALWNTVELALVTVPGALIGGLALALLANVESRWRWLVRLALLMPWALPLSFCGLIGAWFFNFEHGVVNDLLLRAGLSPRMWLLDPLLAKWAICSVLIWKASSFIGLILLAGLQMIPEELYEAASLDGANRTQRFLFITLPLLWPSLLVALVFRTITALQTFDVPYAMTRGGPGSSTLTLAMSIHKTTVEYLDIGYGAAQALALAALSMLATALYLKYVIREADR